MAQASITAEMVTEAEIAAHLAANPNLLPPAVSELSDQAALFASNNTNAFMFTGSADADSENTNFGEAIATKAIEKIIELDERRRKEDDPAGDASMIAELAASQRERMAAMQQISVGGITMSAEDWDNLREGLEDPAVQALVTDRMRARGFSDAQIDTARHWATVLSGIAEWKQQNPGQPLPPEMQRQLDDYNRQPAEVKTSVADLTRETLEIQTGTTAEMTVEQSSDLDAVMTANTGDVVGASVALQEQDFSEGEAAELLARRSEGSTAFAFGDTREGPVISEEYNASAEGTLEVAKAPEIELPAMRSALTMEG